MQPPSNQAQILSSKYIINPGSLHDNTFSHVEFQDAIEWLLNRSLRVRGVISGFISEIMETNRQEGM